MKSRRGFSVFDLIVLTVCGAIGLCLLLPLLQQLQEQRKLTECKNRMRKIAIAAHNFHDAHQRLPTGTLGFKHMPEASEMKEWMWDTFKNQNTSSLALSMPFVGLNRIYDRYDPRGFDMRKTLDEMVDKEGKPVFSGEMMFLTVRDQKISEEKITEFVCPADSINFSFPTQTILVSQPMQNGKNIHGEPMDDVLYIGFGAFRDFGFTNYLANGGVTGCVNAPTEFGKWSGVMTHRARQTFEQIANLDGTSNTIMYGETVGGIEGANREWGHAWMFGGIGRTWGWHWRFEESERTDENGQRIKFLGDQLWSDCDTWGSAHRDSVNFAMSDASVHSIDRTIDPRILYALSGAKDGIDVRDFETPRKNRRR